MEKLKMKLRVELHQVKERTGTWEGKQFTNTECTGVIKQPTGEFFGMLLSVRLPEALKATKPGLYDSEISFEYSTEKRAFIPRIETLVAAK